MADRKKKLTDLMLERLRPPASGRLEINDSVTPGLVVRVTEHGVRTFSVRYKVVGEGGLAANGLPLTGKQHRITIGRWPTMGLAAARAKSQEVMAAALEGRDLRTERAEAIASRRANTFASVVPRFMDEEKRTVSSWRNAELVFRRHVLPRWADRALSEVSAADVHSLLDSLIAGDPSSKIPPRVGSARETRKALHKFFSWAENRELVERNVVSRVRRADLKPNRDAGRALSDLELVAVCRSAASMPYPWGPLFQLLILTGQRRSEWADARWGEIDVTEHTLEVAAARHKSRRGHLVPIPEAAWRIVAELPRWKKGDCLFSTRSSGKRPVSGFERAATRMREEAATLLREKFDLDLPHFRLHDLRVTCRTRMAALRIDNDAREAVLGHAKTGLVRIYDRYDYMAEKREALERYSKHVMELVGE